MFHIHTCGLKFGVGVARTAAEGRGRGNKVELTQSGTDIGEYHARLH